MLRPFLAARAFHKLAPPAFFGSDKERTHGRPIQRRVSPRSNEVARNAPGNGIPCSSACKNNCPPSRSPAKWAKLGKRLGMVAGYGPPQCPRGATARNTHENRLTLTGEAGPPRRPTVGRPGAGYSSTARSKSL